MYELGGLVVTILVDWTSWLVVFGVIIWAIVRERKWIRHYLKEEVDTGLITQEQYELVQTVGKRIIMQSRALFKEPYGQTRHLFQLCAELAQKKTSSCPPRPRQGDLKSNRQAPPANHQAPGYP